MAQDQRGAAEIFSNKDPLLKRKPALRPVFQSLQELLQHEYAAAVFCRRQTTKGNKEPPR
jgi:hypothetical protein